MKFRLKLLWATLGAVILSTGLIAGPASAVASPDAPLVVPTSTSYARAVEVLKSQEGVQSETSIKATLRLASESVHVEEFVNEEGDVVSALAVQKPTHLRAVWWESPGCSSTGACLTMNSRQYGYGGTGELVGSWSGVTRISAGAYTTGLWNGNVVNLVVKYSAKTYARGIAGNKIIRTR